MEKDDKEIVDYLFKERKMQLEAMSKIDTLLSGAIIGCLIAFGGFAGIIGQKMFGDVRYLVLFGITQFQIMLTFIVISFLSIRRVYGSYVSALENHINILTRKKICILQNELAPKYIDHYLSASFISRISFFGLCLLFFILECWICLSMTPKYECKTIFLFMTLYIIEIPLIFYCLIWLLPKRFSMPESIEKILDKTD